MKKTIGFPFIVKSYFTDIDGAIILPSARPAGMPLDYPVAMFASYDRLQGYRNLMNVNPPLAGSFFISSYIYGYGSENFLQFNPLADIVTKMTLGDLVLVYGNSKYSPSHFCFVIVTGIHVQPGAVDLIPEPLYVDGVNFTCANAPQFNKAFNFMDFDRYGTMNADQVSPISYFHEGQALKNTVFMPIKMKIDPFFGFSFIFLGGTDFVNIELIVVIK